MFKLQPLTTTPPAGSPWLELTEPMARVMLNMHADPFALPLLVCAENPAALPNVRPNGSDAFTALHWVGVEVSSQREANEKIPALLRVNAHTRFIIARASVDLSKWIPKGANHPTTRPDAWDMWNKARREQYINDLARWVYMARCQIGIHLVTVEDTTPETAPAWVANLFKQCHAADICYAFGWQEIATDFEEGSREIDVRD